MKITTIPSISIACFFLASLTESIVVAAVEDGEILLESFDNPRHAWQQMNDPVMGGRSTGTFTVQDGVGIFEGEVVGIPFLHDAPGFIQVRTKKSKHDVFFPDVSSCSALQLVVKSSSNYDGYRVSFGNAKPKGGKRYASGYKANMEVPTSDFGNVVIPFGDFTDFWDDATGDAIHTCQEDHTYCPDEMTLKDMKIITIWAEGVAGKVSLEIQSISAVGCAE
jgi:hypothetical protein